MARRCKAPGCYTALPPARTIKPDDTDAILLKRGYCRYQCAIDHGYAKQHAKAEKEARAAHRADKARVAKTTEILPQAQSAFNEVIRLLDRFEPCISCGRSVQEVESQDIPATGGYWDCGHFLSRGAFPELRFCIYNAYKQCKTCNGGAAYHFAKKSGTVSQCYEERLSAIWGDDLVTWLRGPHPVVGLRKDEVLFIRDYCRKIKNRLRLQIRDGLPAHTRASFYGLTPITKGQPLCTRTLQNYRFSPPAN